jgi:hypothetical protein
VKRELVDEIDVMDSSLVKNALINFQNAFSEARSMLPVAKSEINLMFGEAGDGSHENFKNKKIGLKDLVSEFTETFHRAYDAQTTKDWG